MVHHLPTIRRAVDPCIGALTLVVFLAGTGARGIDAQELAFSHFTTGEGRVPLPSASVQSVYQDREGFIWFAFFSSGVGRYDGRALEMYGTSDGLSDMTIRELQEDAAGHLWVSTENGLVVSERPLPDYGIGERVAFRSRIGGTQLVRTRIRKHWVDCAADGSVWVAPAGHDLIRYRMVAPGSLQAESFSTAALGAPHEDAGASVLARRDGSVWLASESGPLAVLASPTSELRPATPAEQPATAVSVLAEGVDGALWAGGFDGALYRISERGAELVSSALGSKVSEVLTARDNELWVSSLGDGALRLNPATGVEQLHVTRRHGLSSETVWDLLLDREGNVWFATNDGCSRLRPDYRALTNFTGLPRAGAAPLLPEPTAFSGLTAVDYPSSGAIWVGTGGGLALVTLDGKSDALTTADGLISDSVYTLARDAQKRLWVGGLAGLTVLSESARLPVSLDDSPARRARVLGRALVLRSFPIDTVYALRPMTLPRREGSEERVDAVWVAGTGGLFCWVDGVWFRFRSASGLPAAGTTTVAMDSDGLIWVGSQASGVFRSLLPLSVELLEQLTEAGDGGEVRELSSAVFGSVWNSGVGAPTDTVHNLMSIGDRMWVASSAGLVALRRDPVVVEALLDGATGLGGDRVLGMARHPVTGNLWVSQGSGVVEVDPEHAAVLRTVGTRDGLVDDETWVASALSVAEDGSLLVATPRGLSVVRVEELCPRNEAPQSRVRSWVLRQDHSGNNEVRVEYAALSFGNEAGVRFRTRLLGYDDDWTAATADTAIRYTNLAASLVPRRYVFEVSARTERGEWAADAARHEFLIRPAWWRSWWAVLAYAALCGAAVFAFIALRTERFRRHTRDLEDMVAERTREIEAHLVEKAMMLEELEDKTYQAERASQAKSAFLATMSHELRTPLNSIIGFSEVLLKKALDDDDPRRTRFLNNVLTSGRELLELINDILDLSKIEAGKMELGLEQIEVDELVHGACRVVEGMAGRRAIEIRATVQPHMQPAVVDGARLKQILYNLVSNAVKFSHHGGLVEVSARQLTGSESPLGIDAVELAVRDHGVGIEKTDQATIFEQFQQVKTGAAQGTVGTGLGLALVWRFVQLMHGTVELESTPGVGSTFTVLVPRDVSALVGDQAGVQPSV